MAQVTYPLDTTGISPANKVVDEPHLLTEINGGTYRILILDFAPFYQDNFGMKHVDDLGQVTNLVKNVDFFFTLPYLSASKTIGKMLYGGVAVNSTLINGRLLATYQTLGGDYTADVTPVREALVNAMFNPRIASWDVVANKPEQFPPVNHDHDISDLKGMEDVVDGLQDIRNAILAGPNSQNPFLKHLTDTENPHGVSRVQLQIEKVANLELATDQEVHAYQSLDKYVTLRQVLWLMRNPPPN